MQQYFELVDWQGPKLPSAETRQQDGLKGFEYSVEAWKDWIRLEKDFTTLGEEPPPAEFLPGKVQGTESGSNKVGRKQRGVWTKSASRGQHVEVVVMSIDTSGDF